MRLRIPPLRFTLRSLIGLVVCCAIGLWLWGAIPKWRRTASLRAYLIRPVTLQFVDTPLGDILAFVRDYTGHDVNLDDASLQRAGIATDVPEHREQGLRLLAEIKPYTDQAIPALVACASSGHGRVRDSARAVLEVIAPEALAALDE